MAMVLAHGGTLGLVLESLAAGLFMLVVWLIRWHGRTRAQGQGSARRPQKPAAARNQARRPVAHPSRPAAAKRRR
jgi:hypothetical protein